MINDTECLFKSREKEYQETIDQIEVRHLLICCLSACNSIGFPIWTFWTCYCVTGCFLAPAGTGHSQEWHEQAPAWVHGDVLHETRAGCSDGDLQEAHHTEWRQVHTHIHTVCSKCTHLQINCRQKVNLSYCHVNLQNTYNLKGSDLLSHPKMLQCSVSIASCWKRCISSDFFQFQKKHRFMECVFSSLSVTLPLLCLLTRATREKTISLPLPHRLPQVSEDPDTFSLQLQLSRVTSAASSYSIINNSIPT